MSYQKLKKLKDQHIIFAKFLATGISPKLAAAQAGVKDKASTATGYRWSNDPLVRNYVTKFKQGITVTDNDIKTPALMVDQLLDAQNAKRFASIDIKRERLFNELYVHATLDPATLFDEEGKILEIRHMPEETRHSIQSIEQKVSTDKATGETIIEQKVKFWPKTAAIALLLDHIDEEKAKVVKMTPEARKATMLKLSKDILKRKTLSNNKQDDNL